MADVKTSTGIIASYMRLCVFLEWMSFWGTIYVLPCNERNERLLRHELCHLEQIERDSRLLFALKYSWLTLRHGYWISLHDKHSWVQDSF